MLLEELVLLHENALVFKLLLQQEVAVGRDHFEFVVALDAGDDAANGKIEMQGHFPELLDV